jgi:hypothetical protein
MNADSIRVRAIWMNGKRKMREWYDRWLEGEEVTKGENGKKAEEVKGERCSLYPFILSVSLHIHYYYNFSTLNPRP